MRANGSSDKAGDHLNTGFVMLPTALLADVAAKRISEAAFVLYAFLRFWQGPKNDLWYGIAKIAERTGFSQSKVKKLMNEELLPAGHISRQKRMNKSSRTKCLTYVDKRIVFVGGKPVNGKTEWQTPDRTDARGENVVQEEAKPNTKAPKVEENEEEVLPAFSERVVEPARDDQFLNDEGQSADVLPEEPQQDMESNKENGPTNKEITNGLWKRKLGWDARRRIRFHELSRAYGKIEAKRVFLEELSWDDPEAQQLYETEFPDTERIPLSDEPPARAVNGSEAKRDSLNEAGKPDSLEKMQVQTDEVGCLPETEQERREIEARDAWNDDFEKWRLATSGALQKYRRSKGITPVEQPRKEDSLSQKAVPTLEQCLRVSLKNKIRSSDQLRDLYNYYSKGFGEPTATHLFLKEVRGESPELEQLYKEHLKVAAPILAPWEKES